MLQPAATFLTRLCKADADAFTILKVARHSSMTVAQEYAHTASDDGRACLREDAEVRKASQGLKGHLPGVLGHSCIFV